MSTLLLMNIETIVTLDFLVFARALHALNRLDRIILNEAHLLLIVAHYRCQIVVIEILRRVLCSFVCMTITLFSFVELKMKTLLHFIQCDTLRVNSDQLNLEYRVQ